MSIPAAYLSHADARKAGWFSRRHQTAEAHQANTRRYRGDHKKAEASERQAAYKALTLPKKLGRIAQRRGSSDRELTRLGFAKGRFSPEEAK